MTTILTYKPKDYRSRGFGIDFSTKLIKASIKHNINRVSNYEHRIEVAEQDVEAAKQLFQQFSEAKSKAAAQFKAGIKVQYARNKFNVSNLYDRLKRNFPGEIYLPESWRDCASIQNYSQNDFWSFSFIFINGAKKDVKMNGAKVIVSMLSKKSVWILPKDFQSRINGLMEDRRMEQNAITRFEELLDGLAEYKFAGSEWQKWFDEKKMFATTQF